MYIIIHIQQQIHHLITYWETKDRSGSMFNVGSMFIKLLNIHKVKNWLKYEWNIKILLHKI